MEHIPVRRLFWDALEVALEAQTHRLAKDIATALGQPEGPLLKALRTQKVKAYLLDTAGDQDIEDISAFRCSHMVQEGTFLRPCGAPVVWSETDGPRESCPHHSLYPNPRPPDLASLTPIQTDEARYIVKEETGEVFTEKGDLCGRFSNGKLYLFEIET